MEQVNGNHHLTMSVGPAQEDYDFHARALGMRSVTKTVLSMVTRRSTTCTTATRTGPRRAS
jgi:hypothetical protein